MDSTEAVDGRGDEAAREIVRAALVAGQRYGRAGRLAGRSERTVKRWMAEPAFRRSVAAGRDEMANAVTGMLSRASVTAASVLIGLVESDDAVEAMKAAQLILQWSTRFSSQTDLVWRLEEIERRLALETDDIAGDDTDDGALDADIDSDTDLDIDGDADLDIDGDAGIDVDRDAFDDGEG